MKTTRIVFFIAAYTCLQLSTAAAQSTSALPDSLSAPVTELPQEAQCINVVKLNLSPLTKLKLEGQYERVLSKSFSIALGGRISPNHNVSYILTKNDNTRRLKTLKSYSLAITPEFRWYLSSKKPAPQGFYIAAYCRYQQSSFKGSISYDTIDSNMAYIPKQMAVKGPYSGLGFGLMIGSQWMLGKHITFDWFIAGGHYGPGKMHLEATSKALNLSLSEQESLLNNIYQIDAPLLHKITADVASDHVIINSPFPLFGLRAAGFNIGYAF